MAFKRQFEDFFKTFPTWNNGKVKFLYDPDECIDEGLNPRVFLFVIIYLVAGQGAAFSQAALAPDFVPDIFFSGSDSGSFIGSSLLVKF